MHLAISTLVMWAEYGNSPHAHRWKAPESSLGPL